MAPLRWTSAEQLLWLQNEMPGYLQMQKEKKLSRFFDALFPRWFSDFPEETELNGSPPCDTNAGINEPNGADINEPSGADINEPSSADINEPSGAGIESVIETAQLDSLNATDSVEQEDNQSNSPPIRAAERRKAMLRVSIREQRKKSIELPLILGQVFEELSALTGGWHYTVVMGGADPLCEGDIMTLSYHHGKTTDGLSFKASTPNFHEQYLLPFE
ncbi:hypothetical protein DFJ58DRAFT_721139 [Suillus subalutaceus]|uniref:uncharacterized protein n=1 Tax=Suillus subalutaceus TaxID=48586 RepID=UPI001B881AC4|nr:uncharacterized protein DFJ58DRAFT_721139 [Suillus subalutaceus]KAG1876676.1 hypothetical protein DFJ58DRAFT_721139 [Suillus subalutaceus]